MTSESTAETPARVVHATPTKDFFVEMMTKDISLTDCILDLIDNAIDGARRTVGSGQEVSFAGFSVTVRFNAQSFSIEDNCGGIRLSDAIDYAFHFGRRPDAPDDVRGGIGLYGVGMKRAIFKIGRYGTVDSHAEDASYSVIVDVDGWKADPKDWDFKYEDIASKTPHGTKIVIDRLAIEVAQAFEDTVFVNALIKTISRDYAFLIQKGLAIVVGDVRVPSAAYNLRTSVDITPAEEIFVDDGVSVRLTAGLLGEIPDVIPDELRFEQIERFGWYVICNDRVVLAADKSTRTVWGNDQFQVWHPQYSGFAGFAFFYADDQRKLPWTTTKRDVDLGSSLYLRTLARMKELTRPFIDYTNQRKGALEEAKEFERIAERYEVRSRAPTAIIGQQASFPRLGPRSPEPEVTISYRRPKREVDEVRSQENDLSLSAKEVGVRTFLYYRKMELGK
jgi:hypothetical protein